jgi:MATE family multidrug resistance protein
MGIPISVQGFLESLSFVITGVMMGWFSAVAISSNQIAMTMANASFMVIMAMGTAVTISVSHFYGARNVDGISQTSKAAIHMMLACNSIAALLFITLRNQIPLLFTSNAEVVSLAAQMLIMVACFQVFDALQCAGIGVLRGIQDVKIISVMSLFAYLVLNIPLGYLCGFVWNLGPIGLYIGFLIGLGTAASLYLLRIQYKIGSFRKQF